MHIKTLVLNRPSELGELYIAQIVGSDGVPEKKQIKISSVYFNDRRNRIVGKIYPWA